MHLKLVLIVFMENNIELHFNTFIHLERLNALDLMHIDVCYIGDRSIGGPMYFVTFIIDGDEYKVV